MTCIIRQQHIKYFVHCQFFGLQTLSACFRIHPPPHPKGVRALKSIDHSIYKFTSPNTISSHGFSFITLLSEVPNGLAYFVWVKRHLTQTNECHRFMSDGRKRSARQRQIKRSRKCLLGSKSCTPIFPLPLPTWHMVVFPTDASHQQFLIQAKMYFSTSVKKKNRRKDHVVYD